MDEEELIENEEEFLEMIDTINFTHIKMCKIELIHCMKVVINEDNTQDLVPLTTDFRINY